MKYLIAFSGGLDSTVLLYQFSQTSQPVRAVHVHHGLSPHAEAWATHCQKICGTLKISLQIVRVQINRKPKESLEALAREARYKVFANLIDPGEILVTAHHQNDQAETFLLHAFRGAGPKGLAAMPRLKEFAQGWHWRPFLDQTRETLENFAKQHSLHWIEDESNANIQFDRNFIRHQLIPLLETHWPKLVKNISRAANIQAELSECMDNLLAPVLEHRLEEIQKLNVHVNFRGNDDFIFPLTLLNELSYPFQSWLLRDWIKKNAGVILSKKQLTIIRTEVIQAKPDKRPKLKIGKFHLHRYANALWLVSGYAFPGMTNHQ